MKKDKLLMPAVKVRYMRRVLFPIIVLIGLTATAGSALATEENEPNFPAGTSATNIASFPPYPGVYFYNSAGYAGADSLYDVNGKKVAIPFRSDTTIDVSRVLVGYPIKLPGNGALFSQVTLPYISVDLSVAGQKSHASGLANPAISPVIAQWAITKTLSVVAGLDIVLPGGSYHANETSVSTGYTSWAPNVGFRYTQPNGLDVGVLNRVLLNEKDHHDNYKSGDANEADFEAGWDFGRWELGAVGTYYQQFTNDRTAAGLTPAGGDKLQILAVGPSVTWAGKFLGKYPLYANLNWQTQIEHKDSTNANQVQFILAFPIKNF